MSTYQNLTILFTGTTFQKNKKELEDLVKNNGGVVASRWSNSVTHLVVPAVNFSPTAVAYKAVGKQLPIISEDWITSGQLDHTAYVVKIEDETPEEEEEEPQVAPAPSMKTAPRKKLDSRSPFMNATVHEDYACMLNQTNSAKNNNKFYVIQLQVHNSCYIVFTAWGRVGEVGTSLYTSHSDLKRAIQEFEKKFKSKTSNNWSDRANFVPKKGKYTLIEVDDDDEDLDEVEEKLSKLNDSTSTIKVTKKMYKESALHPKVKKFVDLIFNPNTFTHSMAQFELDVKKMPLGKLSKTQIAKGFAILDEIEEALKNGSSTRELSDKFFTAIPHSFGRRAPPIIDNMEALQKKMDMLNVLSDIEIAQNLVQESESQMNQEEEKLEDNPSDVNYKQLSCGLDYVEPNSQEYANINTYITKTMERKATLLNIYRVNRMGEEGRYSQHDNLDNRRLLWHGTNIAVIVSCLKTGLRIMPHSGGRVGKGIYTADIHGKSASYTSANSENIGVMFLAEVALGKINDITRDDPTLKKAPNGFDSVVARGWKAPDPQGDIIRQYDGRNVVIPNGDVINTQYNSQSSFAHNEYLVYKESQVRIRYALEFKFTGW